MLCIKVKTRWFKEDDNLVRYTYEATEGIDFHTIEEVDDSKYRLKIMPDIKTKKKKVKELKKKLK